ncbi:MAG: 4-hydroxy-tetrahydrodipicolinate synthase [Gemmatimonadaceae bacterium]|jgi:4-hydroxy-tetrahydrodipicolinate synthase|nr:4-hydroxy-tetrahydrodipicolinate synthase [Gemmatimonadaceae bacterium]
MSAMLRGCGTALVTPFTPSGDVDWAAFTALVEWQLVEGIDFLVPCGSTGEAATLNGDEHEQIVRRAVEVVAGRVPVVAGAGSNDTRRAIALSHAMARAGATHLLHVSPMYSKPPQRGIIAHFRAIAEESPLPVVLYNVPGRTASNMLVETTLALAEHPNITAIKEASGNLQQIGEIIRHRPSGFGVLSGDDALTRQVMLLGGEGVISVVSNAVPRAMTALTTACAHGRVDDARRLETALMPWMQAAFVESNPIPAKAALAMMGRIVDRLRLPLVSLAPEHHDTVRDALRAAGIAL